MDTHTPLWDPEMRAAQQAQDALAATLPPVAIAPPYDENRRINDRLALGWAEGGPALPVVEDRWVAALGRRILCRLYRPNGQTTLPALLYFHGGGWVFASIDTHDRLARELALGAGAAVISVDYALSPEARFPRGLEECAAVLAAISRDAGGWGIDPARIVVGGDSAGANLAVATALLARERGLAALRGILAFYPVCAPDFTTPSYRQYDEGFGLTRARMREFWDAYLPDEASRLHPLAAIGRAELRGLPPTLIQLAELDVLRSEGEALAQRMREAGVAVTEEAFAGVTHGFVRATGFVAKAREAVARAGAWVEAVVS